MAELTTIRIAGDVKRDNAYDYDRRKFVTQYMATAGMVHGWGKTQAAAKATLAENITRTLDEFERPSFFSVGEMHAVVFCQPDGHVNGIEWGYRIVGRSSTVQVRTRADAMASACKSLAQDYAMGDCFDADLIEIAADFLRLAPVGDDAVPDLYRYCSWQRAAKHAHALGVDDVHSWACEHEREYIDRFDRPEGEQAA